MTLNKPTFIFFIFSGLAVSIWGMAFVMLFLAFLDRLLNTPNQNIYEQAVGATVLLPLFFQESNFTLMTGSLLPFILSFWFLFKGGLQIKLSRSFGLKT